MLVWPTWGEWAVAVLRPPAQQGRHQGRAKVVRAGEIHFMSLLNDNSPDLIKKKKKKYNSKQPRFLVPLPKTSLYLKNEKNKQGAWELKHTNILIAYFKSLRILFVP